MTSLEELATQLARVQDAKQALADREAALKAAILDAVDHTPDTYAAGPLTIQVQPNNRLDTHAIAAKYPPDQYPELYEVTVSTKAVRKHFSPVDLEPLTTIGTPRVVIR